VTEVNVTEAEDVDVPEASRPRSGQTSTTDVTWADPELDLFELLSRRQG
jgi:hypothetical protein